MDQISFQKQVIRDEYISKETGNFVKNKAKRIHLSPKQIRNTRMLNEKSSIVSIPWFESKK